MQKYIDPAFELKRTELENQLDEANRKKVEQAFRVSKLQEALEKAETKLQQLENEENLLKYELDDHLSAYQEILPVWVNPPSMVLN